MKLIENPVPQLHSGFKALRGCGHEIGQWSYGMFLWHREFNKKY